MLKFKRFWTIESKIIVKNNQNRDKISKAHQTLAFAALFDITHCLLCNGLLFPSENNKPNQSKLYTNSSVKVPFLNLKKIENFKIA